MNQLPRRIAVVASAGVATLLLAAAPANAAKSPYPVDPEQRIFSGSDGGWTSSSTVTGLGPLCIAPLTCPTIETTFEPSGGVNGGNDGHLRVTAGGLAEVTSKVTATFESPTFRYRGAAGKEPDQILFAMARRTDAGALVEALDDETYSVFLQNKEANIAIGLIEDAPLTNNETFQITEPVAVDKGLLTKGSNYALKIVTEFEVPVGVVPTSTFDYDNVVLVAFKEDPAAQRCQKAKRNLKAARAKQRKAKQALKKAKAQGNKKKVKRAKRKLRKGKREARKAAQLGQANCG